MRRRSLTIAPSFAIAGLASAMVAWLGLNGFAWSDYETEVAPSVEALLHGHMQRFLALAPAYGGSLVERAPFALLVRLWGGGALAAYRSLAIPCLLSAALLGVWLLARLRTLDRPLLSRALALGLLVANPLTVRALELGHPEELLGASLCVVAVLLALDDRPLWAGLVLGAAIANKEWAILACGPVLIALPARRLQCLSIAAGATALILAPLALVGSGGFIGATRATATSSSVIFQPWQAWWFLAHHGSIVRGLSGEIKAGYRSAPPAWVSNFSRPLIIALSVPLSGLAWLRGRGGTDHDRRSASSREAGTSPASTAPLLLLAVLMLMRCLLDTWDTVYYTLPLVFALVAWETLSRSRPPVLALICTVLAWVSFQWLPGHAGADTQAAFFLAWTVPLLGLLGLLLCAPRAGARLARAARLAADPTAATGARPLAAKTPA